MSKIAFVFPGQGSQTVGMCKDLYDNYTCARKVFEAADEALGFSISDMCFNCLLYTSPSPRDRG